MSSDTETQSAPRIRTWNDGGRSGATRMPGARALVLIVLVLTGLLEVTLGCAPRALRGGPGTDQPQLDQPALSTILDREDIRWLTEQTREALLDSAFWQRDVQGASEKPLFAIWPIENRTTQHLGDQMTTLLSSLETSLVNSGDVLVVARSRQQELADEIGVQQGAMFDPSRARSMGRQLGAEYFLTGKLTAVDERLEGTRRVQYTLFIQVIEVETGLVTFQNEAIRSKALKG